MLLNLFLLNAYGIIDTALFPHGLKLVENATFFELLYGYLNETIMP